MDIKRDKKKIKHSLHQLQASIKTMEKSTPYTTTKNTRHEDTTHYCVYNHEDMSNYCDHHDPFTQWEAYLRADCINADTVAVGSIRVGRDDRPNLLPWTSPRDIPQPPDYKLQRLEGGSRDEVINNWSAADYDVHFTVSLPVPCEYMEWSKHIATDSTGDGMTNQFICIFEVEVRLLQDILTSIMAGGHANYTWTAEIILLEVTNALKKYKKYVFMTKSHYNSMVWLLQHMVRDKDQLGKNVKRFLNLRSFVTPFEFKTA